MSYNKITLNFSDFAPIMKRITCNVSLYKQIFHHLDVKKQYALPKNLLIAAAARMGHDINQDQLNFLLNLSFGNKETLNEQEFCQFLYILENSDLNDPKAVLFFTADLDFGGTIDLQELTKILDDLGFQLTAEQVQQLFTETKDNEDGSMSYDMFEEVINAMFEIFAKDFQNIKDAKK